jgi:hypothetical protein
MKKQLTEKKKSQMEEKEEREACVKVTDNTCP